MTGVEVEMVRGNAGWRVALFGVAAAVVLAACPPPRYDPKLEVAAADWTQQIGTFITDVEGKAGTPAGEYEPNKKFYEEMQSTIGGQIANTKAAGGSDRAVEIMDLLSKNIENLRKLHESGGAGGLPQEVGEPARAAIETQLRAMTKLQSELRSGSDNG
jgi:hypothetical protein